MPYWGASFLNKNPFQYPSPLNYRGFPKSVCTSVNNCVCHGIPDDRPFADGDHGDCSKTFLVGNVDDRAKKLVQVIFLPNLKNIFFGECLYLFLNMIHSKSAYYT
jgi:hypothetical protein